MLTFRFVHPYTRVTIDIIYSRVYNIYGSPNERLRMRTRILCVLKLDDFGCTTGMWSYPAAFLRVGNATWWQRRDLYPET